MTIIDDNTCCGTPAIADGVGVKLDGLEPSDFAAARKWHEDNSGGTRFYYTIWCALNYLARTPPQAATDDGV